MPASLLPSNGHDYRSKINARISDWGSSGAARKRRAILQRVFSEMMPNFGRLAAVMTVAAPLFAFLLSVDAEARPRRPSHPAQPSASAVYADERDCVAKGALEADQCHNAALNSHAEYEEKAPRLDSNEACKRFFARHCSMRIGGGLKGITFVPSYGGFRLLPARKGDETMVLPVLSGTDAGIGFTPRPVSRLDTEQDSGRAARAQAAWQSGHSPVIRSAGGVMRYRDAPKGAAPDLSDDGGEAQQGPAATYPVSPHMLKQMQEEMRKYGTPQPQSK
jgi:uncharacterized protein YgiB involved in biofilm formation